MRDLPGSLGVVKTSPSRAGFDPWSGSFVATNLRAKNPKQKTEATV